jgi:hypothetical protein
MDPQSVQRHWRHSSLDMTNRYATTFQVNQKLVEQFPAIDAL